MQVHQKSKAGTASHPRPFSGLRTACLTSGSNRSLRSLGRAKARPLTIRYALLPGDTGDIRNRGNSCAIGPCLIRN